jgi:hypothetical protein
MNLFLGMQILFLLRKHQQHQSEEKGEELIRMLEIAIPKW